MVWLVAALGAVGVVLVIFALPPFNRPRLASRIHPYLSGLHGRPSTLIQSSPPGTRSLLHDCAKSALARLGWSSDPVLARRLAAGGYVRDIPSYRLEKLAWGVLGTLVLWALTALVYLSDVALDPRVVPALSVVSFTSGFLSRDWWLSKQVAARKEVLQEQLPTAIDLVALSVMAGESVMGSFERVGRSLPTEMSEEFQDVVADVRTGVPLVEALDAMKQRTPLTGVERFVDALCIGIERGTPLVEVLRAQADDGRQARRRYLLELGGRREVLMLVPVVFLIMPVVVVFSLYPGLVSLDLLVP